MRHQPGDADRRALSSGSAVYGRRIARSMRIGTVLQRQMEVRRDPWRGGRQRHDDPSVQSIGSSELTRNSTSAGHSASRCNSTASDDAFGKVPPVGTQVHAGDGDLLVTGGHSATDVLQHVVKGLRPASAPRCRDDAVAAAFVASGLHAQRERRSTCHSRRERRRRTARHRRRSAPRSTGLVSARARRPASSLRVFGTTCATFGRLASSSGRPACVAAGHDDRAAGLPRATRRMVWRAP